MAAGNFFMAILTGVLLAFGFQIVLTNLSIALGISAAGNLEEKKPEDKKNSKGGALSSKIKLLGLWSIVTASISLFFASLLSVKLSLIAEPDIRITLGLTIWATFFALMMYLEAKSILSLAGSIWHAAAESMRSTFHAARGAVETSLEDRVEKTVRRSIAAAREEILRGFDKKNWKKIRKSLAEALPELEIHEHETHHDDKELDRQFIVNFSERQSWAAQETKKLAEKAGQVLAEGSEGTEEEVRQYREKIEQYLKSTRREELNPEGIKRDIDRIIREPQSTKDVLLNRVQRINAGTLVAVLTHRPDVSDEEANRIIENVKSAIHSVKEKISKAAEKTTGSVGGVEEKIAGYFNSLDRPEFDYEIMKQDFIEMLSDPKESIHILKERLGMYNRDSMVALLASNEKIGKENAEKIADKIEEARESVIHTAEEVEMKIRERLDKTRQTVLHQAENTRKAAAAAAWWLFAAAVISAGASALGGALAL